MLKTCVLIAMMIVVAACGTSTPTPAGPHPMTTPGNQATPLVSGPPLPGDLSSAQQAAVRALSQATNAPTDQISLIMTEPVEWPDSCLGTRQAGAECATGSVSGFLVVLQTQGQRYEYHTNEDGSTIVLAAEKSPYIRVAVRTPGQLVLVVDSAVLNDAETKLAVAGLLPQAGATASTVYALDSATPPHAVAFEAGEPGTLDFVQTPTNGLAVWAGASGGQPLLGWGVTGSASLLISAPDGSGLATLVTEPANDAAPFQLVAQRWSLDGQALYYSKEPVGLGGYIPFPGASSLYQVTLADHAVKDLIAFNPNSGRAACLDDLSADGRLVTHHCDGALISVQDLGNGRTFKISPPRDATGFNLVGSARFNAGATRVAYALAAGDPNNELGWVAVSNDLMGASQLILTSNRGEFLTVLGWLNADTLLIQSTGTPCNPACASSVWTVGLDGSRLAKVADGSFLTVVAR